MAFSRIPNRWLGIGETLQHAPQACQHSVWQPLGRPECAGSKLYPPRSHVRSWHAPAPAVIAVKISTRPIVNLASTRFAGQYTPRSRIARLLTLLTSHAS